MPDPQNPQNPQPPKPLLSKESLEELKIQEAAIDAGTSAEEMRKHFKRAAEESRKYFKKMFDSMQDMEIQYLKYVGKHHKAKFKELEQERKKVLTHIVEQREVEIDAINRSSKLKKDKLAEIAQLEEKYAKKREEIEKAHGARRAEVKKEESLYGRAMGKVGSFLGIDSSTTLTGLIITGIIKGFESASGSLVKQWQAAAGLRAGGLHGITGAGVEALGRKTYGDSAAYEASRGLSPESRYEQLGLAGTSAKLLQDIQAAADQGKSSLVDVQDLLANIGIGPKEAIEALSAAANEMGTSITDVSTSYLRAQAIIKDTNLSLLAAFGNMLKFQGSLRGVTLGSDAAANILSVVTKALPKKSGLGTQEDILNTAGMISRALGGQSASRAIGLYGLVNKGIPSGPGSLDMIKKSYEKFGGLDLLQKAAAPHLAGAKGDTVKQAGIVEGLAKTFLGITPTLQENARILRVLTTTPPEKMGKELEKLKNEFKDPSEKLREEMASGRQVAKNSVTIMEQFVNLLKELVQRWSVGLSPAIEKISNTLPAVAGVLGAPKKLGEDTKVIADYLNEGLNRLQAKIDKAAPNTVLNPREAAIEKAGGRS